MFKIPGDFQALHTSGADVGEEKEMIIREVSREEIERLTEEYDNA